MAPILCAGKGNSRPSRGRVARDPLTSAFWQSGVRRVKVPCYPISRNPEPRKRQRRSKWGPQYHEAISTVHPQETPGARLGSSPIRSSRLRSARSSSLIPPMREVTRAVKTWGPQQRRVSLGPSDLKDTWHQIKPFRRFAHRDFKKQGSALSYPRTPKAPWG
jgi:hypothetical protein